MALDADRCAIFERLTDGSFALRASAGRPGAVDSRTSAAWLAALQPSAGIVEGSTAASIAVAIPGDDAPFGVLAVCRDEERSFDSDERTVLGALARVLASAIRVAEPPAATAGDARASEDRFDSLFQNSQVGIARVRMSDGSVVDANDRAVEMYGYPDRESLLAAELPFHFADPGGGQRVIRVLREEGETVTEERMRRPDGSEVWIRAHLWRVPGTDFVDGVSIDVTPMREAQEALEGLNQQLRARAHERQQLVRQLLSAQEDERRRVAYEIHDGPAQKLVGAAMFLDAFSSEREQREDAVVEQNLALGAKYLKEALGETRQIMSDLRPALLDDLGLVPALRSSFKELSTHGEVRVEVVADLEEIETEPSREIVLFRVAQEAVGNAVKHSGSERVRVELRLNNGQVELSVRDWGRGFDRDTVNSDGGHLGLVGMRERVSLVGGTFSIESAADRGTTVIASIPLSSGHGDRAVGMDD